MPKKPKLMFQISQNFKRGFFIISKLNYDKLSLSKQKMKKCLF
jgi:hypothetical protein